MASKIHQHCLVDHIHDSGLGLALAFRRVSLEDKTRHSSKFQEHLPAIAHRKHLRTQDHRRDQQPNRPQLPGKNFTLQAVKSPKQVHLRGLSHTVEFIRPSRRCLTRTPDELLTPSRRA